MKWQAYAENETLAYSKILACHQSNAWRKARSMASNVIPKANTAAVINYSLACYVNIYMSKISKAVTQHMRRVNTNALCGVKLLNQKCR